MICIIMVYILSVPFAAYVLETRRLEVNPLTLFICMCPIVNTVYCLIRIKYIKPLLPLCKKGWLKNTLKNL